MAKYASHNAVSLYRICFLYMLLLLGQETIVMPGGPRYIEVLQIEVPR